MSLRYLYHFILSLNIKWNFVLEKSPWWGDFYERIIGIIKRCIKKVVGKDLLNLLAEIKQTFSSTPIKHFILFYSVRMREITDQKNSEYGHFSRSVK